MGEVCTQQNNWPFLGSAFAADEETMYLCNCGSNFLKNMIILKEMNNEFTYHRNDDSKNIVFEQRWEEQLGRDKALCCEDSSEKNRACRILAKIEYFL